jgi:hypothetical protein
MNDLTIRQVIEKILAGQIRVPTFQRGFVWDANRVAYLMDSIYKEYPFGTILLWRTKERLDCEKLLGPFKLPEIDPDYPIDYILDGQQRITSIFGVFQNELQPIEQTDWIKVYFDYDADPDVQESQFVALEDDQVDGSRHFPLSSLFDTVKYRRATKDFDDELAEKIDQLQSTFKEARIPIQNISTEDRTTVAIVFERVNQRGVELDTLQLLSAWTWSEEFDLHRRFEELSEELEPFGFREVGLDTNLLLRCCSAVLARNHSISSLVNLKGSEVRERFDEIENGIKGAIDFLQKELNIFSLDNLPYSKILVPLSVFFSACGNTQVRYTDEQRQTILRWFWRTCFSKRYNSRPGKNLQDDIEQIYELKLGNSCQLDDISVHIESGFFRENIFKTNTVNTKTFILLLAQKPPFSFVSGSPISLQQVLKDYNRNEFHHIYPRAYVRNHCQPTYDVSCLSNFCFLSKSDNNYLGGDAPSVYQSKMPDDVSAILEHSFCPNSIFDDDFNRFVEERSELLLGEARRLLE